jgi:hypothetical protein
MRIYASIGLLLTAGIASANLATFDGFAEGFANSFTDGGITFSNLDCYFGQGPVNSFAFDDASVDLAGQPGFTSPNVLGFSGYSPGTGVAFTRLGSFDFTIGASASTASFDFYCFGNDAGSTITLQGIRNAQVVGSQVVNLPTQFVISRLFVSLGTGTYDSFHIVANSPTNQGAIFGVIDNVNVTPVPEPATLAALALGGATLLRRRKR